jgi:hypothetical protein
MDDAHGLGFPGALADKMLHTAHIFFQFKGHLFRVFALGPAQQAAQVDFTALQLLGALKSRGKQIQILGHFVHKALNIVLGQVTLGGWASLGYNAVGHGCLFLLSTGWWWEKDTMPLFVSPFHPIRRDLAL